MQTPTDAAPGPHRRRFHWPLWLGAGVLLLLPAVAMQFTREVRWSGADFVVMGAMLALACGALELGVRMSRHASYRAGVALAVVAAFLMTWINLAVGIIGDEDNPLNGWYFAVLGLGLVGACLARLRAKGLAPTLLVMAIAQTGIAWAALAGGARSVVLTLGFAAVWLACACLFRHAARGPAPTGT